MGRATTSIRVISLGSIFSLLFLFIAFQITATKEASAQTSLTEVFLDGSPWIAKWENKKGQKKEVSLTFSNNSGELAATVNGLGIENGRDDGFNINGKKVTLKAEKDNGNLLEFSLELDNDGNLSGYLAHTKKGAWREKYIVLKPAR